MDEDLVAPHLTRESTTRLLIQAAAKLARAERFIYAIEWGLPGTMIPTCPWCLRGPDQGHLPQCVLADTLRASSPVDDIGPAIADAQALLRMQHETFFNYINGIRRELDDSEAALAHVRRLLDRI